MTATLTSQATIPHPTTSRVGTISRRTTARTAGIAALVAAVVGGAATMFMDTSAVGEEIAANGGQPLVDKLNDGVAVLRLTCGIGLIGAVALLVFASSLQRRFEQTGLADLTEARVIDKAITGTVGAMFIGFGARAIMAGSLPDGIDGAFYSSEGSQAIYYVLNNFPYIAWMGLVVAAGATFLLGLRHKAVSKPVMVIAGLAALVSGLMTLVLGLPYSSAIVGPVFLVAMAVSLLRSNA